MEIHFEEIDNEIQYENNAPPLAFVFEEAIGPDVQCCSFKINNVTLDGSGNPIHDDYLLARKVVTYMKEHFDVVAHTQGLHTEGKKQIPHIHIHFIVNPTLEYNKTRSNPSQHRNRWFDKTDTGRPKAKKLEMRPQDLDTTKPKWFFLAYPLKEGKYFNQKIFFEFEKEPMSKEMKDFLLTFGTDMYNQKVARDYSNEKAEERKEIKYNDILKVASKFYGGTYREYQIFMEEEYLEPLIDDGQNVPDIDNYKKNIKRAAVQLKFFKSYDI